MGKDEPPQDRKQPPWQVPQPELRPELQNQAGQAGQTGPPEPPELPEHATAPGAIFDPFARERERQLAGTAARKKRSQRRTVVVGLGVTALLAGTITAMVASNEDEADYAQVCFNDDTGERVDDTQCDNSSTEGRSSGIYAWYFYSRGASVPGVGQNRSGYPSYSRSVPTGAKASTGYSPTGGTVSRGGFGSSSKGGSTGG
ncbi:Tat pathway signal protein [Arthrobacter sp. UYCu712]|uniref:Tat pathway signal protein n=1 Tax=Arthrobacter sp. UYCu712 TaxID=3156340 RepID=UPI0033958CE5